MLLTIVLNGESQLEYHRDCELAPQHQAYLDKMDQEMAAGIHLADQRIEAPTLLQRAQFIAQALFDAISQENEALAAAMCAYLATRLPDLKQVKGLQDGRGLMLDLVFDEPYVKQVPLKFMNPGSDDSGAE